jgi:tetratricopeptide (TPR) repeat protein
MRHAALWLPYLLATAGIAQDQGIGELAAAIVRAAAPAADDPDAVSADLLAVARRHARSPVASIPVSLLAERLEQVRDPSALAKGLEELLAAEPHGVARGVAESVLVRVLLLLARRDEARPLAARLCVPALLAAGPFGDSGDHFDGVPFPPELEFPAAGSSLPGRGRAAGSRVVVRKGLATNLRLADADDRRSEGCYYGLHQIDCGEPIAGYVHLECDGSFELFVNGRRIAAQTLAEEASLLVRAPVGLRRGRNHVLVKTTKNGRDQVLLRYVDARGAPLPGVTAAEDQGRIVPVAAGTAPPPPPAFTAPRDALESALRDATGAEATTLRLALAFAALRQNEEVRGLQALHELAPPADPQLAACCARAWLRAQRIPPEQRRARARALVDAARKQVPDHHDLRMLHAQFLEEEDRGEDVIRLLQPQVAAERAGPETFRRLYDVQSRLQFTALAVKTLARWRAAFPGDAIAALHESRQRTRAQDAEGAHEVLLRALALRPGDDELQRAALETARVLGRPEALSLCERLHADDPEAPRARVQRATHLLRLQRQDEAVAELQQAVQTARDGDLVARAGELLARAGRGQQARAAFERALELDPAQHNLRRHLARERGEDEFVVFAPYRRDSQQAIAEFKPGPQEAGAPTTALIDQLLIEVMADGSYREETHQLRRINDQKGVESQQAAERAAAADEVVALRTITADGKGWVPNRVQGQFQMPRLEPGSFVEQVYRSFAPAPAADPSRVTRFYFRSDEEPYAVSELVVIVPPALRGSFRVRSFDGTRTQQALPDGRTAHVFRAERQARLPAETRRPPDDDILPVVALGEDRAPGAQARAAHTRLLHRSRGSPQLAELAARLTRPAAGDRGNALAIHRFVHETIPTSDGAADALSVLLLGKGPRFSLELALLRAAGIPFRLAIAEETAACARLLPQPLFEGESDLPLPAALVAPRDGDEFWLFGDAPRHAPLGLVPAHRAGGRALLLAPGADQLVRLPDVDRRLTGFSVRGRAALDAEGNLTIDGTATLRGDTGLDAADWVQQQDDNVRRVIARQLSGQVLRGFVPANLEFAAAAAGQPLALQGRWTRAKAVQPSADRHSLVLPLAETRFLQTFGDRAERKLPLRLEGIFATTWELELDSGPWRLRGLPPALQVSRPPLDYELSYRLDDGRLWLRRDVVVQAGEITPAQFGEWLALLQRLDRAEQSVLELSGQ